MKKVLVTGSNGQLGRCIQEIAPLYSGFHFVFTDKDQLDITQADVVDQFMGSNAFDYCINAAAYTLVEQAEEQERHAFLVNATAVGNLAKACNQSDCVLVHISTDYVFDGKKSSPYTEDDEPSPLSVYGASKLAGEQLTQKACPKHYIFRTSWLYSLYGQNFLQSISNWLAEGRRLNITTEQTGTPTNGHELARQLLLLISEGKEAFGLYHLCNQGEATWFDFAKAIAKYTPQANPELIQATDHYPTKAKRPDYSVMSNDKAHAALGLIMDQWEDSLEKLLQRNN